MASTTRKKQHRLKKRGLHYPTLYKKAMADLEVARRHTDGLVVRAKRASQLEREIHKLRREIDLLKLRYRRHPVINKAEYEGRSAASWARESKAIREILHDHHLNGWCAAQADVNRLLNLLRADHRYKKADNWRVALGPDGYAWTCSICQRTYPAPLDYYWAVRPCPHPGAPEALVA